MAGEVGLARGTTMAEDVGLARGIAMAGMLG